MLSRGEVWRNGDWSVQETCADSLFTVWREDTLVLQVLVFTGVVEMVAPMVKLVPGEGMIEADDGMIVPSSGFPAVAEAVRRAEIAYAIRIDRARRRG